MWDAFVDAFSKKYFPEMVRHQKEAKFLYLVWWDLSVAAYEARFTELTRFVPYVIADEPMRTRKFLRGLRPGIKNQLSPFMLNQYSEAVSRALAVE